MAKSQLNSCASNSQIQMLGRQMHGTVMTRTSSSKSLTAFNTGALQIDSLLSSGFIELIITRMPSCFIQPPHMLISATIMDFTYIHLRIQERLTMDST
jgi:hypothetical protein